jgi:predicted nucleotidyltransferase component of viral defense system
MVGKLPLARRLRKESHRQIALAQDLILEEVYRAIPRAILHGGTGIWRCYAGRRFSEDLDFYFPEERPAVVALFESLKNAGFIITKKKISSRSVYSELLFQRTTVRLEGTFQQVKGIILDYEKADGTLIAIYGLSPEELVREKAGAYLGRRKIRDIYDVFFLLKLIRDKDAVLQAIRTFLAKQQPPVDESDLKVIIIEGIAPTYKEIMDYIKRWERQNT